MELLKRQDCLPVLHIRGSHYDVGYNIGRTFGGLIKCHIDNHPPLNDEYIPLYETIDGKEIYDKTYQSVLKHYPHYIRELKGMSDGSGVPFYKLFLLHLDEVLPVCANQRKKLNSCQGCSSICLNEPKHEIIGHNEDGFKEGLNNVFILDAQITESDEHFTAFCYAGLLPGYAMGFNKHGLIYSINIIGAKNLGVGKLPRAFVTRDLLTADSFETALSILRCRGCGIADAMNVNMTFLNQPGDRLFHNIEVSPSYPMTNESAINVRTIGPGEVLFHANKFVSLNIPEFDGALYESSVERHTTQQSHIVYDAKGVTDLLGDMSSNKHNMFRNGGPIWTLAVGIFDCIARTWSIYMDNPKTSKPIVVIPLDYN